MSGTVQGGGGGVAGSPISQTLPWPNGTGQSGTVDITTFMKSSPALSIKSPSQRTSGVWLELTNDSDSALLVACLLNPHVVVFYAPGDRRSFPVPLGETTLTWTIMYQNPTRSHAAQQLTPVGYSPYDVLDGFPLQGSQGTSNPSSGQGRPNGWFDVTDYGAVGDGVHDDTAAINAALAAFNTVPPPIFGGQVLYFPPNHTYAISSTIAIAAERTVVLGGGRCSIISPLATFPANAPLFLARDPTAVGNAMRGMQFRDLLLYNATVPSARGIELDSTYGAVIERVDVEGTFAIYLYLNGQVAPSTIFGAYTHIHGGHLGPFPGGAGPAAGSIGILTNNHEWSIVSETLCNFFNGAGAIGIKIQNDAISLTDCAFDACDTSILFNFCRFTSVKGCHFDRGITNFLTLTGAHEVVIEGNVFETRNAGAAGTDTIAVGNTGTNNVLAHNIWFPGTAWTNAINETLGATSPSLAQGNHFGGLATIRPNSINGITYRDNTGTNPGGAGIVQPAVPASGTPLANPTGFDAAVSIATLGTLTAVALGGVARTDAPAVGSTYRVPVGQTITLTYAGAAPTWQWYGD